MRLNYTLGIAGGTFDHFHSGHARLLDEAFNQSEKVIIGVSLPQVYTHKVLANSIESFAAREDSVKQYLTQKNYIQRSKIVPLKDMYGNTLQEKTAEAIFITTENVPNVQCINAKRTEIGFPPLQVVQVPYVTGEDGSVITSARIRAGEIDRNGHAYFSVFKNKIQLTLPALLREHMRQPIGNVVKNISELQNVLENSRIIITAGDIISHSLRDAGQNPDIAIIDFKSRRHILSHEQQNNEANISNPAGTIRIEAVEAYRKILRKFLQTGKKQTLIIDGEEDLLALPAILLAPLESVVLYGQYDLGIIVNKVTEELKQKVEVLLKKFAKN